MPQLKTPNGVEWNFYMEGQGEALLFIHGWGVDGRIWRQQIKHFAQSYLVISIDLPGHGKSSWQSIALHSMAQDLYQLLGMIDVKQVSVIGSSLGGLVSLKLFELYPQIVKKIAFVGSMPKFSKTQDYPYGLDISQMRKLGGQLNSHYPSIVQVFFRSLFTPEERRTRRYLWLQKFRQHDPVPIKPALVEYLDVLEKEDLTHVLKNVHVPLQFMNGTGDQICCRDTVSFLRTLRPEANFVDFDKCGHFPFLTKSYEFNTALEEFLKKT